MDGYVGVYTLFHIVVKSSENHFLKKKNGFWLNILYLMISLVKHKITSITLKG